MKHGDYEHIRAKYERARNFMTLSIWICLIVCILTAGAMVVLTNSGDASVYFSTRYMIFNWISVARLVDFAFKVTAGIYFLKWLSAAVRNGKEFHPYEAWTESYWVFACWFVPVANLYSPFVIMHNLLKSIEIEHRQRQRNRLLLWWLCYTLQNPLISFFWCGFVITSIAGSRYLLFGAEPIISGLLYAFAGYFLLPIMNAITNAQERTYAAASANEKTAEPLKLATPQSEIASNAYETIQLSQASKIGEEPA